uniref:Uncharacterized protein n=1 Tax=Parascaris univalens TaxID=6257 RepID=A0A915BJT9_PARUN
AANEGPKRNVDLDELAQLNEKLLERSRGRRADYKLVDSEIIKTAPEPVTPNLKQPRVNPATVIQEQIREMLESRISNDTSVNSTIPQQDRSGYVTDVSSATWQFSTQSFSPRSVVSINGGGRTDDGLLKVRTDLSPELSRTMSRSNAAVQTAQIEDDKPRGIMKRRELETKDQMMYVEQPKNIVRQNQWEQREIVQTKPKVTETVQKFEEHKRTEEIERRVQRKERREKKHRSAQRSYHHSGGQEMLGYSDGGYRSSSLSRNGYLPAHESYMRTVTTRRERDGRYSDDGRYHTNGSARYGGSISDSLRRGEMKYNPNGEIREVHHTSSARNGRVHKSYSTRDVFDSGNYDDRRSSFSYRRGSQQGGPFVEFPPTLPRVGADHEPPMPPPHRGRAASNDFYRPITKSRSYADWDEGRGFTQAIKRRDEDMARLENEFRDSLLMPLPTGGGNMYERDHRHEQIPGGYETYDREVKSSSGRRLNRDGNPTQFSEASQEYSYKREQETDRRR